MKNWCLFILLSPFFAQGQQSGFSLTGQVEGLKPNSVVVLTDANNPTDTLAKTVARSNKFVLIGRVSEPGLYNIVFTDSQKKGIVFLDNSKVTVSGNVSDVQNLKFEGSSSNADFMEFRRKFEPIFLELNQLDQKMKATGVNDSLSQRFEVVRARSQDEVDAFIKEKNNSFVAPFLVLVTAQLSKDLATVESRYNSLPEKTRNGYYGKMIKDMVESGKVGTVGSEAIDFTQNDPQGKPIKLSSFRGKYVLVDFWASWCGPCRQENPNVVSTYNLFKNKNFTVLGVSLDRAKDSWLKAIQDDGLTWTHVSDLKYWNNEVAQKYHISQIPQNFLVGPDGKIVAVNLRGAALRETLEQLIR